MDSVVVLKKSCCYLSSEISKWKELSFKPHRDIKIAVKLDDGNVIECAVFQVKKDGELENHACISTQVGCRYNCSFCTSGKNGFVRNMTAREIINQLKLLFKEVGRLDCVLFMGVGEPLDNYSSVITAIKKIIKDKKYYTAKRHIYIATNGGKIRQITLLSKLGLPLELWISLHAPDDQKRSSIMPINKTVNIKKILETAKRYARTTNTTVLMNYLLYKDFNNSLADAKKLANIFNNTEDVFHINLTEPNCDLPEYQRATARDIAVFKKKLYGLGVKNQINHFLTAGKNIKAGCGEFALIKSQDRKPV